MAISVLKSIGFTGTAISVILVSFLYLPVSFLIKKGGLFKDSFPLKTKFQLTCKPIYDLPMQCNDFVIHEESSTSIYTCAQNSIVNFINDREEVYLPPYVYDIETKKASKLKITDFPENKKMNFKNIKIYKSKEDNKNYLFFINENEKGNTIEKFEYLPETQEAVWKSSIKHNLIKYASDFTIVNDSDLYIINKYNTNNK
eukprot:jgi/Orpsp1_1/1192319/evm.model.d7180000092255.1